MRTRLAMLACVGPHTTPWMLPQGGESHVRIMNLMDGERIVVESESSVEAVHDSPGTFIFQPASRFRFRKERDITEGSPTLVEVLYG